MSLIQTEHVYTLLHDGVVRQGPDISVSIGKALDISGRSDGSVRNLKQPIVDNHGHSFTKKNFNSPRPVYCHICLDLLNWSLFNTGLFCEGSS